jgi:pyruvate, water dikinase
MVGLVVWFSEAAARDPAHVGGKVAGLADMLHRGMRVPPGFAIRADAYRDFLVDSGLHAEVASAFRSLPSPAGPELESIARGLYAKLLAEALPAELSEALGAAYAHLGEQLGMADPPVAVRSSATREDGETASFAGEYETYLWVRGLADLRRAVQGCWASLFSYRALAYCQEHGISALDIQVAVGVQKMVRARSAGVLFTLNPATGDVSRIAIEGSWGLGSVVVGGEVTPDRFMVEKVGLSVCDRQIATKTIQHLPDPAGGVVVADVPEDLQREPCLREDEVLELAGLGKRLHEEQGRAQDVEWAIDADLAFPDNVFLLQCRPETVWSRRTSQPILEAGDGPLDWIVQTLTRSR